MSSDGEFTVSNDGQYGGGSNLEHRFRECDWSADIDGMTLPQISQLAASHANSCDGTRVIREAPAGMLPSPFTELWGPLLKASLERGLVFSESRVIPGGER